MLSEKDLREYLNISEDDDVNLSFYINAARGYAKAAGLKDAYVDADSQELYDMCIANIAGFLYDNRGLQVGGAYQASTVTNAQAMLNAYVLQLRGCK